MLTASLLLLVVHAGAPDLSSRLEVPSSRVGLLASAETNAAQKERLAALDEQLRDAPTGWPVGTVVGAAVGFSLTGAMAVTALVLMFAFTGAEGAGIVLGVIVLLAAIVPLTVAIVFAIVGATAAKERQNAIEQLENERRAVVEHEPAANLVRPAAGLVLARF